MQKTALTLAFAFIMLLPLRLTAQVNIIVDGGFEAGPGSGNWIEYSTNFGTPLCEVASCGNGGGTGPHSGTYWAYFGGAAGIFEEGSLRQSIFIPSSSLAILSFYLEMPVCGDPTDFLNVIIDGTDTVYHVDGTSPLCGVIGYSLQTISLQNYADGNTHSIEFYSITNGTTNSTNISVDDVSLIVNANLITGKVFFDINNNFLQDAGEPVSRSHKITETTTGQFSFSDAGGLYNTVASAGNFVVTPAPVNYYTATPSTHNITFAGINQIDSLNDFALQAAGTFNDLCITITPLGPFRSGFNASYMINYENAGTTTINGDVIFFPYSNVSYVSSSLTPASVTADSVIWNTGSLTPFQTGSFLIEVHVNVGLPLGTLINSSVRMEPVAGDANPGCNYYNWEVYTMGSFDPNDILVNEDTLLTTQFPNPPYLDYIIRFQNTGNDTAFTVNILNPIDTINLQLSTLEFVNASHPVGLNWLAWNKNMEFKFENILLPDSNINEPMSHGFVHYRIKPKATLVAGNSISNNAYIYFDFNAPVATNTAITRVVLPTSISDLAFDKNNIQLFPNPAQEQITITLPPAFIEAVAVLTVFDVMGKEVYHANISTTTKKLSTKNFANGVYFMQVQSGSKVSRVKFVKQ